MLPALHESGEVGQLHRLDLFPEGGKCPPSSNFNYASRAPLDVLYAGAKFSTNKLASPFPLCKPGLDPFARPSITIRDLLGSHWACLRQETSENLSTRDRCI